MASKNDKKISDLLASIESKRKSLGEKPKAYWKTNGILDGSNINTLNSVEKCVFLTSRLLSEQKLTKEACEFLGVQERDSERVKWLKEALKDVKLRVQIINWETEKKKLQAMERKLKDLRSDDAKTEDALADIAASLK